MEVLLGLGVAVSLGISDVYGGVAGRRLGPLRAITGVQLVGVVVVAIYQVAARQPLGGSRELTLGALGGVVLALAAFFFYTALTRGRVAVVSPVTFAAVALFTLAIGLFRGERPSATALAGVCLVIVAVILVSRPAEIAAALDGPGDGIRRLGLPAELALATGVGAAFATFQTILSEIGADYGISPLLMVRAIGFVAGVVALGVLRARPGGEQPWPNRRNSAGPIVVAGVLLTLSHWMLIEALDRGFLSIVGPLTALAPAFTVLGARLVLHEHVSRLQVAGMGLMIAGLLVVGFG